MAIKKAKTDLGINVLVETSTEFKVSEEIKDRVEKALQQVINDCSTEFYRNIKANIEITLE